MKTIKKTIALTKNFYAKLFNKIKVSFINLNWYLNLHPFVAYFTGLALGTTIRYIICKKYDYDFWYAFGFKKKNR